MSQLKAKQAVLSNLADITQAIGHPHRLELLEHLANGRRSVEALAETIGLTHANTSRHLQILRRMRLVTTERQGKYMMYRLDGHDEVNALLTALRRIGERNLADVQQIVHDYFSDQDMLEPIMHDELLARLHDGSVTLIDVRPEYEFVQGHLPGALNMPLDELENHLAKLSKSRDIVAYCRGPHCVLSKEAVALLRAKGFRVRRLKKGFPGWKAAGFKIETAGA